MATGPHAAIYSVACADEHAGWSAPEAGESVQVVLVRRGRFRRAVRGRAFTVDPTMGYLDAPGVEQRFAHPAGGDVCTAVTFDGDALAADPWLAAAVRAGRQAVRVDGRLELAHRRLARTGADPEYAAAEAVVELLALAVRRSPDDAAPAPGRARLAERAREAIVSGAPAARDLVGLARSLEASPSHLSRTFRHHVGMTVSRYRNRVRVSRALERIAGGETDLAGLAAALGFSDQAHLGRTLRRELGHTPGRVRELLGAR